MTKKKSNMLHESNSSTVQGKQIPHFKWVSQYLNNEFANYLVGLWAGGTGGPQLTEPAKQGGRICATVLSSLEWVIFTAAEIPML
jgi:hypothetical protein